MADEVRKLAESSSISSQQITELVKANVTDMQMAVAAGKAGAENVERGIKAVGAADDVFGEIVTTIEQLVSDSESIAAVVGNMAQQNEQMLRASDTILQTSDKNAAEASAAQNATEIQSSGMREIAEAAKSLATLAGELSTQMKKFKV